MTENREPNILLIGKSRRVLDDAVAGLRDLGYTAQGTNDFAGIPDRYDAAEIDLVVFGGLVPPELKAELRKEFASTNPRVIFVNGLAGIPGLIVNQVRGALNADEQQANQPVTFDSHGRSIAVSLEESADVKITLWWQTTFVPPDPSSDSLVFLDENLLPGVRTTAVPDHIPERSAFATVQINAAVYPLSISGN